jgi:hypothetical protein
MRVAPLLIAVGLCLILESHAWAGLYAPPAWRTGSTAVANTSQTIAEWASGFQDLIRGPLNIADPRLGLASFGAGNDALGLADGVSTHVVSLGDGGRITLTFAQPIIDGSGFDFAVFENGFGDSFLELAFVEVSSNGTDFVRFPAVSLTPTATQVGAFGTLDATNLDNLAGKYRGGFGTPFDLSQVAGLSPNVDVSHIQFVRVVDVVGTIDPTLGSRDSLNSLVNDPYATPFASGGFDLDGVGVLNMVPEPSSAILLALGSALFWRRKGRRRC